MTYTIESVRHRDGSVHERELRRKGHQVNIKVFAPYLGAFVEYVDESPAYFRTSPIISDVTEGSLRIITSENTVYTFKEAPAIVNEV